MTIGLQVTDGTVTVDLNDGSYFETMEVDLGFGDVSAETAVGTIRVYIDGTKAQIQTELAALQKLLQQAVDFSGLGQGGALYSSLDNPVYLNYRTDSTEDYYRSLIVRAAGRIENQSIETLNFDCGGVEYLIDFERKNWWEGAEVQVQQSTHLETATTNAVIVWNPTVIYSAATIAFVAGTKKITDSANGLANFKTGDTIVVKDSSANDGTYTVATGGVAAEIVTVQALINEGAAATVFIHGAVVNYTEIAAAQIGGDLPAATRIEMENEFTLTDSGLVRQLKYVWIGHGYEASIENFVHLYQGEAATVVTPTEDVDISGGAYGSTTVTTGVETDVATWAITAASMGIIRGRYVKFIAAFLSDTTAFENFRFRLRLYYGTTLFWQSSQVQVDTGIDIAIRDLFTFALPPALPGVTEPGTINLTLTAYQATGSNQVVQLDWMELLPVDGFMWVKTKGVAQNWKIILDGFSNVYYVNIGGATDNLIPYVFKANIPIMLQPGRKQRLYFNQHTDVANEFYPQQVMGVKVYYRPRRLSI